MVGITRFIINYKRKHPYCNAVPIDYKAAMLLMPSIFFGLNLGVMLFKVVPQFIQKEETHEKKLSDSQKLLAKEEDDDEEENNVEEISEVRSRKESFLFIVDAKSTFRSSVRKSAALSKYSTINMDIIQEQSRESDQPNNSFEY